MNEKAGNSVLNLGKTPVHTVLLLAWPAILEQLMFTMLHYVDTAMVGAVGAQATASVGISASSMWMINGFFAAVGIGFSIQVAHAIGATDYNRARSVVRQSVLAVLLLGALATVLCQMIGGPLPLWLGIEPALADDASAYFKILTSVMLLHMGSAVFSAILRCGGDTKTPMILNAITNILNIILNTLFIFPTKVYSTFLGEFTLPGLGMGVRGAALASAISMGIVGALLLLCVFRLRGELKIDFHQDWRFDAPVWRSAAFYGIPAAFERIAVAAGQMVFTTFVSRLGTIALASHTLANAAESISYLPATGVSYAATTLVGQAKGAGDRKVATKFARISMIIGIVMLTFMGVLLFFGSNWLISIFTRDLAVIALGGAVLKIEALVQPLFGAEIVLAGAMRGGGDARFQLWIGLLCTCVVRLVVAYVLAFGFGMGLYGIWCGMAADIGLRGVLNLWRFYSGKWYTKQA